MYDYVRRQYGVEPEVGQPVRMKDSASYPPGKVAPEDASQAHYVMVRFDGWDHDAPVHPTDLEYLPRPGASPEARAAQASFEELDADPIHRVDRMRSIHRSYRGEGGKNFID